MSKNIKFSFLNFLRVFLLIIVCLAIALLIVWPLWKISTTYSNLYTIIVLAFVFLAFLYLIISKIRKTPLLKTLRFIVNILIIIFGLIFSVYFVLNLNRLIAVLIIVAAIAFEILVNYLFSLWEKSVNKRNGKKKNK